MARFDIPIEEPEELGEERNPVKAVVMQQSDFGSTPQESDQLRKSMAEANARLNELLILIDQALRESISDHTIYEELSPRSHKDHEDVAIDQHNKKQILIGKIGEIRSLARSVQTELKIMDRIDQFDRRMRQ